VSKKGEDQEVVILALLACLAPADGRRLAAYCNNKCRQALSGSTLMTLNDFKPLK